MTTTSLSDFPECERMNAVADESQKIGDFLDWLDGQGISLVTWRTKGERLCEARQHRRCEDEPCDDCGSVTPTWVEFELTDPVAEYLTLSYNQLLARYFEIDLNKVEQERRALLEKLRSDAP